MAKQQRTILICDRCNIEHNVTTVGSYSLRLFVPMTRNEIEWHDLCPACGSQIETLLKGLVIGKA